MRKHLKFISVAVSAALAATAVAGIAACGTKNGGFVDEQGIVHLTFAGRSNDSEEANYEVFINDFMQDNPNYDIQIDWSANESAYMQKINGMGSNLPDLFMLSDDQFIAFAENGLIADYKEFVDMDELDEQVYTYAAEAYCYNTETDLYGWDKDDPNCGFYGYPKDQGPLGLMYNKTLFEDLMEKYNQGKPAQMQISLPSATEPYTFDEFIDVCTKLKGEYDGEFYPCAGYDLDSAIYSNNADYFTPDASQQRITDNNFVQAIEFMQRLYSEGIIAPRGGTTGTDETAFINGRALFYYAGPWKMKDYWKQISFEWDLAPVCVGPAEGAVSTAYVGSMGYCISANSQIKEHAAYLAKYLATYEGSQRSQYRRGQAIPNLRSMAAEFSGNTKGVLSNETPKNRSVWIDVIDGCGQTKTAQDGVTTYVDAVTGKYRPGRFTYSSTWRTYFAQWLDGQGTNGKSVWKGQISARESLNALAPTMQNWLDEMKEIQNS